MSLRRTAFLWLASLMAAVGISAAAASYFLVRNEAGDFLDNQLRQIAIYVGDAPPEADGTLPGAAPHDPEDDFVIQVWDAVAKPLRLSDPGADIPRQSKTGFSDISTATDNWRVYTLATPRRTVQVSQEMSVRQELATNASLQAALPIALLIPLSWLTLGWIIDRIMARLNRLAIAAGSRDTTNGTPIPVDDVPAEVIPFVGSINKLLTRLHALLDRQRRFVSDAAHELRTPLTALQIQIDNLRYVNTDRSFAPRVADLQAGIGRVSALVGQLLRLARYDADEPAPALALIDLAQIAIATVARLTPLAESRSIDLGVVRQDQAVLFGSLADFEIILGNLIDNSVRYTPSCGTVDVAVEVAGPEVVIEVRDTGPGISKEQMPRVFERFFRAASQDVEGSGLGLAIAKAAADRNRALLSLENRQGGKGLVARLSVSRAIAP
jgi:two-component system, OmpR family, sensor kinase